MAAQGETYLPVGVLRPVGVLGRDEGAVPLMGTVSFLAVEERVDLP